MQALKEIQKYQNGADLLIWRLPFQRLVRREGTKVAEYSNPCTTRSRGSILSRAPRTGKYMCHSHKMSDHNAEGHSVGTENQRTFLKQKS